jgi:hypothetical protein
MANKTSFIKWGVISFIILLLLILVFISLTPARKQQIPFDYIAEYNRINKPADFNPNDNAAPYFDKAFEVMAEAPNDVKNLYKLWPGDMNNEQIQTARQWVESNWQTIDYLQQAISKKYYWKPLQAENNELLMADANHLPRLRKATYLLCLDAKLMVQEGRIESAFQQLADVYKMGTFLAGPKLLIDQLVGIAISTLSVDSAFQILDHTNPSPVVLEDFQKRITSLSLNQPFLIDISAEKLMFYDIAQRRYYLGPSGMKFSDNPHYYLKRLWRMGPAGNHLISRETLKANELYNYFSVIEHKTPWQIHSEGNDVSKIIDEMTKGTLLLNIVAPAFDIVLKRSYRIQVYTDGLVTTIAILRYKADKGIYPQNLQGLVSAGYLEKIGIDPFSGNPLVYKLTNDNFVLYSFAQDFDDDGGKHDSKWASENSGDYVFWPVQPVQTPAKTNKSD